MHLNGENKLNVIKWVETRDEHAKVLRFLSMKTFSPQGCVCSCPGAIYMHMTKIFKHLCNRMADQSHTKDCINGRHGYKLQKPLKCSSEPVGL